MNRAMSKAVRKSEQFDEVEAGEVKAIAYFTFSKERGRDYPCYTDEEILSAGWVRSIEQTLEVRRVVLYLRACNRNLITLAETDAHLLFKRFGAHIDVDFVIAVLDDQFHKIFPCPDHQEIYFIDHSFDFHLGAKVILG